ncbi:D-2-hydroxyacid dehydrogenase [Anaerovorax odorimutans]|uniref:D-2-hydroxyacid dehydrogenase n=1 Tax=Anaerovorax odorimutans TaxID=109327 RepID=UPI00041BBDD1|nr:D-2-hydroxyacid dehydrogenase [Anaerovorax odorimutans]
MKIVVLDGYTTNSGDLSWDKINKLGELIVYERTSPHEIVERAKDAEVIILNAVTLNVDVLKQLPKLKLISILATGYNNVDLLVAKAQGIAVCNTPTYSTEAVSQHTIALLLEITNNVALHSNSVHNGAWHKCPDDCFYIKPLTLLDGKTMGIIGYGNIGKRVGRIAEALGMKIIPYSKDPEAAIRADVISLHCPVTRENQRFVNSEFISKMKDGVIFLNTARGELVDELALFNALKSGKIAAAGVDVLRTEPPKADVNCTLMEAPNCFITPHHAWMPIETRQLLLNIAYENIKSFINGDTLNRVDL